MDANHYRCIAKANGKRTDLSIGTDDNEVKCVR